MSSQKVDTTHWNKDERSLIVYLETRMVDHSGVVNLAHLNDTDRTTIEGWVARGLIEWGRLTDASIKNSDGRTKIETHWVILSEEALDIAYAERRARIKRGLDSFTKYGYVRTCDKGKEE